MSEVLPEKINLKVEVKSKFNYGGIYTGIDIRDSELILIEKLTVKREFNLTPGLYEISAFLGDGKRASKVVEVFESQLTEVSFKPDFDYQPETPSDSSEFKKINELDQDKAIGVSLLSASNDFTIYPTNSFWIVQHKDEMQKMSVLTFEKNGARKQVSLPISQGHRYSVTCHVRQVTDSKHDHLKINISQSRSLAFGLESMLKSGQIINASQLASSALDALIERYKDPTGATLAALILYKTGKLDSYNKEQLINLTRNNEWLADAKITLALYLARNGFLEESLAYACEASKQRILLTENFSLLLDLIRYWPESAHNEQRNEALACLARIAPHVIWESMYLTTTDGG
ncbi:hypothetical protein ACVWV0_000304 [Ewingella americana]|jgi:hypothetical protein